MHVAFFYSSGTPSPRSILSSRISAHVLSIVIEVLLMALRVDVSFTCLFGMQTSVVDVVYTCGLSRLLYLTFTLIGMLVVPSAHG